MLNLDHAPTWLDILGQPIPKDMQGRSYKAILDGKTPLDWRTSMYYRYWMHLDGAHNVPACYGVRTKQYTLIHYYGKGMAVKGARNIDQPLEWELFDLGKDVLQMHNVINDPAYAGTVRELRTELDRLRREYGDER